MNNRDQETMLTITKQVENDAGRIAFKHSYSAEGPKFREKWNNVSVVTHTRKVSTYINELINAGLMIERIEEGDLNNDLIGKGNRSPDAWYSVHRAKHMPTTLIVKARKPFS